jgi:predicted DNA-binding transcriptional regulator YafY
MNSLERRDSLLRLLRRRSDWTIADLASELDVSRRTILRDVSHLRERGFDISGMSGPGGGVHLEATSVMITSHLDTDEVVALILSVAIARATTWIPFADGAERALAKIEAALPTKRVGELQRFMQRVLIGDAGLDLNSAVPGIDPTLVATFERAFTSSRLLAFSYVDRERRRTRRRVEPHGLLIRAPLWYVIAWDPRRDAPRLFRADRVRRPSITEQTFLPRPHELVTASVPTHAQRLPGRRSECPVDLTGQLSNLPRPLRELIGPVRSWTKASD